MMRRLSVAGLVVALLIVGSAGASGANRWPPSRVAAAASPTSPEAWIAYANGAVSVLGGHFHGDARREPLARPITGIASTATGKGYWLVAADGGVFSYGAARFYGSLAGRHLNAPIVGIASSHDGHGYWLVAADGGVFSFGDARFHGSLAGTHLDQPVIAIMASHSGKGYRLLARDGGVFAFGDAPFEGSLGGSGITDVVGFASTSSGNGYWILRKLGGSYQTYQYCTTLPCGPKQFAGPSVANFGDAHGSPEPSFIKAGSYRPIPDPDIDFVGNPVIAITPNPALRGYFVVRAKGTFFGFGGF